MAAAAAPRPSSKEEEITRRRYPAEASLLSYESSTSQGDSISTSFRGGLSEETYKYCVFGCEFQRMPTAAPTVSAYPTPVPSTPVPSPSPTITPIPTVPPTSAPSSTPTEVPTGVPTSRPSPAPSPMPTYEYYYVAVELRFTATYCEDCGGWFITLPADDGVAARRRLENPGRRREDPRRRLSGTVEVTSLTMEEILDLDSESVTYPWPSGNQRDEARLG